MTARHREAAGLLIRYADTWAPANETVLLLNPWPESLFAWEAIWPRLAETVRLVAIDLPGFGQSEGRAELLSPSAMAVFLLELVDEWGLEHPHIVGPNLATSAVLFAAAADRDCFPSAVVGSGAASVPLELGASLEEIVALPDLRALRAVDGSEHTADALEGIKRYALPESVREDYLTSYAGERFVDSAAYVRRYPSELPVLAERLGEIRTPIQIIAGSDDLLVPPSNAEFLHARLPQSKLDVLEAGHYLWEDAPEDFLELTECWVDAHSARRSIWSRRPSLRPTGLTA